ncbi:hypothetical protein C4D60_Mb02t19770 [Musa balbisiana]|uniref:Uncharacterized protein n=1 Tax=Musa balbisiana TaxID=52838 RepID=A0A4S8IBX8_MUSBA|nr:hypothetical protein C4D60_Mb02t19770 [Musa balbisiana]
MDEQPDCLPIHSFSKKAQSKKMIFSVIEYVKWIIEFLEESGNRGNDSLEDIQLLESAYKGIDDLHPGYEDYGHNIVSELGKNNLEHLDAEIEDLMLYSNDVAPHALLVSPERWSSGRVLPPARSTTRFATNV